MKTSRFLSLCSAALVAGLVSAPSSAQACAACFGRTDSKLGDGLNWGILSLLGVVLTVLLGIGSFFLFHIRRAAALERAGLPTTDPESATKI